jgi:hypothetical protein
LNVTPFANLTQIIEDALTDEYASVSSLKRNLITCLIHLTRHDAVGTFNPPPIKDNPFVANNSNAFPNRFRIISTDGYGPTAHTYEYYALDGRVAQSKIFAIKYIRQVTSMGLKDSKDYVESLPVVYTSEFNNVFNNPDSAEF